MSSFLTLPAFLSWLKLSVYMSIVAVAIVLNFHLKSKPSTLGKTSQCNQGRTALTRVREEMVTPARYCVLVAIVGMLVIWSSQLHRYGLRLQPPSGTRADRLENTDCVYCGCSGDCSHLRVAIVYKCAESVDGQISSTQSVMPTPSAQPTDLCLTSVLLPKLDCND